MKATIPIVLLFLLLAASAPAAAPEMNQDLPEAPAGHVAEDGSVQIEPVRS